MNPTHPPTRVQLILQLKALTKALEDHGATAEAMAPLLAARGWSTSTIGDGTSRGTSELTSTERAAAHPDRWVGVDEKLARFYLTTHILVAAGNQLIADLAGHAANDDDHLGRTTGTHGGWCMACERWVPGTHDDRLRSGFCNACRVAWARTPQPRDRAKFIRDRPRHQADTITKRTDPRAHRRNAG